MSANLYKNREIFSHVLCNLKSDGGYRGARFKGQEGKDGGFGTVGDVGDGRGDGDVGHDVMTGDAVSGHGQYRKPPVVGVGLC